MKVEFGYKVKLVPEKSDDMSAEDILREIVAFTELTRKLHDLKEPGFHLYSRESFLRFCDVILSLVKQEVY